MKSPSMWASRMGSPMPTFIASSCGVALTPAPRLVGGASGEHNTRWIRPRCGECTDRMGGPGRVGSGRPVGPKSDRGGTAPMPADLRTFLDALEAAPAGTLETVTREVDPDLQLTRSEEHTSELQSH